MINTLDIIESKLQTAGMRAVAGMLVAILAVLILAGCATSSAPSVSAHPSGSGGIATAHQASQEATLKATLTKTLDWSQSPVITYGTPKTNAGWFSPIPGTPVSCGWETRGVVGGFCTSDGDGATFTGEIADWGTVDGHKHCDALLGDTSYVFCRDGYRTVS